MEVAIDGTSPFKKNERVKVKIDAENNRLIIEKLEQHTLTSFSLYNHSQEMETTQNVFQGLRMRFPNPWLVESLSPFPSPIALTFVR
jgi:hypothetical protein